MAIELIDIEDHDSIAPDSVSSRVGCIMMNDDNTTWTASCPGLSYSNEGVGLFDDLPDEVLWIVNRGYLDIQDLLKINAGKELRLSKWMRIPIEDMGREWGIENLDTFSNIDIIASIYDRVLKLCFETVQKASLSPRKGQLHNVIERSPSLATGIRTLVNRDMDASVPDSRNVREQIMNALIYGVFMSQNSNVQDGEFLLHCQIPRLSHALRVTTQRVPAAGRWVQVNPDKDRRKNRKISLKQKITEPLEPKIPELQDLDRPVMVMANVRARPGLTNDYLGAWVNNNSTLSRLSYTLEEVVALLPWFSFEDYNIIVGPDWRHSVTGKIINSLVDICGGHDVAATSWSANAAAENILCGGFRKISGNNDLPPECVWLTAQDRIQMIKPVESLMNCGATLVQTYVGGVTIKIPEDPEIISQVVNIIWESGMHLPIGTVRDLQEMNIELPVDPEFWGGAREDLILGQCLQKANRNVMWRFDEIQDQIPEYRKPVFDKLFQQ